MWSSLTSFTYKLLAYLSTLNLFYFSINKWYFNPYSSPSTYTIGDSHNLKIGILSDSQLTSSSSDKMFPYSYEHLLQSLQVMKNEKIEVLIFAGDEVQTGTKYGFKLFKKALDLTWPDEKNRPIYNFIMGNHDYRWNYFFPSYHQKLFYNIIGEKPYSHKIINGYHFINWGHGDYSMETCNLNYFWFEKEIEKVNKENKLKKPIFVITHVNAKKTVYGSEEWGNFFIKDALNKYEQVVHISGHSHFSLIDERSIWQGNFTSIQTQSTSYIELETGKENGPIPLNEFNHNEIATLNYMGLIININDQQMEILRISLPKNQFYHKKWIIQFPIIKNNFMYVDREKNSLEPFFEEKNIQVYQVEFQGKKYNHIKFLQAKHENFVHSYRIVFSRFKFKKEFLYFSDFYLMPEDRKEFIVFKLNDELFGEYDIQIYAIESFGKESLPLEDKVFVPLL